MIAPVAMLAAAALVLVVWSYLLYPAMVENLSRRSRREPSRGGEPASLEVLLSAADEQAVIAQRIENLLAQEAAFPMGVAIGCDGCRDKTAEVARASLRGRGRVVEFPERRGKAAVLNDLVRESAADVLVFTDANTRFLPGAVQALAEALADPAVGAACGKLVLEPATREAPPENAFWDRETRTKEAEGRLGVCLGANGAIYAARRSLIEPLPPGAVLDDFLIPARIARRGKRVVFAGGAVAREPSGPDVAAEVSRRFRIGAGAGRVLREESWLWNVRRHRLLSVAFFSRKAARWIAPVLALAAAALALADARLRLAGGLLLAAALSAMLLVRARPRLSGLPGRLYYFCVINVALAAGVLAGLAGYRRPAWRRTL